MWLTGNLFRVMITWQSGVLQESPVIILTTSLARAISLAQALPNAREVTDITRMSDLGGESMLIDDEAFPQGKGC